MRPAQYLNALLQLDEQLIGIELPAVGDVTHVVVVDDEQVTQRGTSIAASSWYQSTCSACRTASSC